MDIKNFKMVADFNIWSLSHDDEVYTITTEDGEELFDVIEEDFLAMVDKGVVNHEGSYYLLNNPSEKQIREYASRWGIKWIDVDDPNFCNILQQSTEKNTNKYIYIVDCDVDILEEKHFDELTDEEIKEMYEAGSDYVDRYDSIEELAANWNSDEIFYPSHSYMRIIEE